MHIICSSARLSALILGAVALIAVQAPCLCQAETTTAQRPPPDRREGSRIVGVSSICYSPEQSIETTERYIDTAALDAPDIILLTESCMQNSQASATVEERNANSDLLPEGGPITKFFARKARQHNTYIIASYWRKEEKGRGRYNSAVLFDRQGAVVGVYDKVFPTIGELENGVLPGKTARVFDTDFGRVGAIICFDLNFPELLEQYKRQGAELLCFLSMFRGGAMVPDLARRNQCFIASSVPRENGVIVDPLGRTLAESSQYGRIIFARINLDSQIVHIDNHVQKTRDLKRKYTDRVQIETASPEAVYFLSSSHPDKSIQDMMKEFGIVTLDEYLARSRALRERRLLGNN